MSETAAAASYPSLAVVIPVYNEAETIRRTCGEIEAVLDRYPGEARAIAVDDGSEDESAGVLREVAQGSQRLEVCIRDANGGYGAALRTGAERAAELGLDYVVFIDADLTNPPADILRIGELIREGHPYVKASRFLPGGGMPTVPWSRRMFSQAGNFVARTLFGTRVRDVTNGFRAVRTDLFLSWPLTERGFAVIVEEFELALRDGVEPVEFPTTLGARDETQRATAFAYSPSQVLTYLRYPARSRLRRARNRERRR